MQSLSLDLETILSTRLEITQRERQTIRDSLNAIDLKLKTAINRIGKKPRESLEEVNANMEKLEHTASRQSNSDERDFMRQLDKYRQIKKQIVEHNQSQQDIDNLKAKKSVLVSEVKEKERTLDELFIGMRKLKISKRLGCGINDVIEHKFSVPEEKIAQIIGRGGTNLKQIEGNCSVSIETERTTGGELSIMGTQSSIQAGIDAIMGIVNTSAVEFSLSDEIIVCMLMDKAAVVTDLQNRYDCRLDVSRAKRLCKIFGQTVTIEATKMEILAIPGHKRELIFESTVLPFIVGKGGAVVQQIGNDHSVQVDIIRGEPNKIVIVGRRENVERAAAAFADIMEENKEVEEIIKAKKNIMIGCVIGSTGGNIRYLKNQLEVNLRSDKGTDGDLDCLYIRGTVGKVLAAKHHILGLIRTYEENSETIIAPLECLPIIFGKKGSRIKELRDTHPNVNIDIENDNIRICSGTKEERVTARGVIDEIIAANYMHSMPCDAEMSMTIKSAKGAAIRSQFQSALGLTLDIDDLSKSLKLRGRREAVLAGVTRLQEFMNQCCIAYLTLNDEDCISLMNGINMTAEKDLKAMFSPTKMVEAKFGVEVFVYRTEHKVRLRGVQTAIESAKEFLVKLLNGDLTCGSLVMSVDSASYAAIIGKSGGNLKKMETDLNVKVDLLKTKSQIRIRGTPVAVVAAKFAMLEFIDSIRISEHVTIPVGFGSKELDIIIATCVSMFIVDISVVTAATSAAAGCPPGLSIKGPQWLVDGAKHFITECLADHSTCTINIQENHWSILASKSDTSLKHIRDKHGVSLELSHAPLTLKLSGRNSTFMKAKLDVFRMLGALCPAEFLSVAMSTTCLRKIGPPYQLQKILDDNAAAFPGTAVDLSMDWSMSCIRISGNIPVAVAAAAQIIRDKLADWSVLHGFIDITDEHTLPLFVGKSGAAIVALEKSCGVSIKVNRQCMRLEIEAPSAAIKTAAMTTIQQRLLQIVDEHFDIPIDSDHIGSLVGKQGVTIKKFRQDSGASVEIDMSACVVKINGTSSQVQSAKELITKFLDEEKLKNTVVTIPVPFAAFAFVIGTKGATVLGIQSDSGATRIDLSQSAHTASIRGSPEACAKASAMIQELLTSQGFDLKPAAPVVEAPPVVVVAAAVVDVEEPRPVVAKSTAAAKPLSKSSLRRSRRKQQAVVENEDSSSDNEHDKEQNGNDVQIQPSSSLSISSTLLPPMPEAVTLPAAAPPISVPIPVVPSNNTIFSSSTLSIPGGIHIDKYEPTSVSSSANSGVGVIGRSSSLSSPTGSSSSSSTTSASLLASSAFGVGSSLLAQDLLSNTALNSSSYSPFMNTMPLDDHMSAALGGGMNLSHLGITLSSASGLPSPSLPPGMTPPPGFKVSPTAASQQLQLSVPNAVSTPIQGHASTGTLHNSYLQNLSHQPSTVSGQLPHHVVHITGGVMPPPPGLRSSSLATAVPPLPSSAPATGRYQSRSGFSVRL